jgi:hypothetical protein
MDIKRALPIMLMLLLLTPTIAYTVSAANWTYNFSTEGYTIDIVNSTYFKDWFYYLIISNKTGIWEFPVVGFAGSLVGPFVDAFKGVGDNSGSIFYLILFGIFILMVWRQSGKTTIPALIAAIVGGAWGMLFPQWAWPWCTILLVAAMASQLLTFMAKE